MTDPSEQGETRAVLLIGERRIVLEHDVLHVVGSGEKASVRVLHRSILPAHALFAFHRGEVAIEPIDGAQVTVQGQRIAEETSVASGSVVSLGDIALVVQLESVGPETPPSDRPIELGVAEAIAMFGAAAESNPTEPTPIGATGTEPSKLHPHDASFGELMAEQLRRAPWFAISLTAHLVVFVLLRMFVPSSEPVKREYAFVDVDLRRDERLSDLTEADLAEAPEVTVVQDSFEDLVSETPSVEPQILDPRPDSAPEAFAPEFGLTPRFDVETAFLSFGPSKDLLSRVSGGGGVPDSGRGQRFRTEVQGLRKEGFDLVIVFDSTGSMDGVLQSARARLETMLEVLQRLVPSARVAIVAFRDHGSGELYRTRVLDLDDDIYRALLFVRTIRAGGGGDIPEDVDAGLEEALEQRWTRTGRRVAVLVGDAPAHDETRASMLRRCRRFARRENSAVHTILTTARRDETFDREAEQDFREIATEGGGEFARFEGDDRILQQILTLSIGAEFAPEIERAYAVLGEESSRRTRLGVAVEQLDRIFRDGAIDPTLIRRVSASRDPEVARELIGYCGDPTFPATGRHAAAYALQEILELPSPPIEPDSRSPRPLSDTEIRNLLARVDGALGRRRGRGR